MPFTLLNNTDLPNFMTCWNPVVLHVFDSDNNTKTNFRYKFTVYCRNDGYSITSYMNAGTYEIFPLQDGTCKFDISKIVQNYFFNNYSDYDLAGLKNVAGWCIGTKVIVECIYTENGIEYTGSIDGQYKSIYLFDGAVNDSDYINWKAVYNNQIHMKNIVHPVLSNISTDGIVLKQWDYYTVDLPGATIDSTGSDSIKAMMVRVYSSSFPLGWRTFLKYFDNTYSLSNVEAYARLRAGVGPANLNAITNWDLIKTGNSTISYPTLPIIDGAADRYEVVFYDQSMRIVYSPIKVFLDKNKTVQVGYNLTNSYCSKKNKQRIWLVYKNKFGAWSWLPFHMENYKTITSNKRVYQRKKQFNDTIYQRGYTTYANEVIEKLELNGDLVPISEQYFYEDLVSSPSVYLIKPYKKETTQNSNFVSPIAESEVVIPITIENNDYLIQKNLPMALVQYKLNVTLNHDKNIQGR